MTSIASPGMAVTALIAAAPLAIVLLAMGALHRPAAVAGAAGLAAALLLGVTIWQPTAGPTDSLRLWAGAASEAVHATAAILWIILPALSLYEYQRRTGAIDRIRAALTALTDDRRLQVILIAWFFGLFMEGAAGFGTPVALCAPLLVGLGYSPVRAVALALLGHAAGVSFGAVGTPVLAQVELASLPAVELATATALLNALAGPIVVLLLVRLAGDGPLGGADLRRAALAWACFFVPFLLLAVLTGPELPTLGGALLGGFTFIAGLRGCRAAPNAGLRRLAADLSPYLVILALVLVSRLVPPLREELRTATLQWQLWGGDFSASFQPLYHPGSLLLAGFLLGALSTGRGRLIPAAVAAAARRLIPVALALLAMLALSRVMVHNGMIAALAEAAGRSGPLWPLFAPAVGVLGTFVSGSATASNILFTELQVSTAAALGLSPVLMAAAQCFGAAIGNIVAPHNIIAGSATVGLVGREGDVLARTAFACLTYVAWGGLLVLAFGLLG